MGQKIVAHWLVILSLYPEEYLLDNHKTLATGHQDIVLCWLTKNLW